MFSLSHGTTAPHEGAGDLICPECSKPLTNTGGYQYPRYRCIARECQHSVFKPVNPQATTWDALRFI